MLSVFIDTRPALQEILKIVLPETKRQNGTEL